MATYVKSEVKEFLDKDTGEIFAMETSKTWTAKQSAEQFYMTFIDMYSACFTKINSDRAKDVLTWMCMNAEFNTGRVLITPAIRKELCQKLDISSAALSTHITALKKLNLVQGNQGTFFINPEIFWKGELSVRNKLLKDGNITFTISFDQEKKEKKKKK